MKAFIIAGTHSGAGKTTIALGIMAALQKRGMTVQPFKVGPDYIDPSHHKAVCGRPSYNLDTWMMGVDGVKKTFAKAIQDADIGIIEGVMGLFDGKDGKDEKGSTAHVAKVLGVPVILVIGARSMARSAGALVYGFERFDPKVKIAGVIFNRIGSDRHFRMLKQAVEAKCKAKVLGFIPRDEEIGLPERHLGLVMPEEQFGVRNSEFRVKNKIAELIEKFVDVDRILRLNSKFKIQNSKSSFRLPLPTSHPPKIAVAYDSAFCFYYRENLDMLKKLGAELVFFSPLKNKRLPEGIEGIYLGGGYPELYAKRLETNKSMRRAIKDFADKGFPVYAECGGLMYLGKMLKDLSGKKYKMSGVFPWISQMLEKRKSLGYREVKISDDCPFLKRGEKIRGHEFHYSEIDEPSDKIKRCYLFTAHSSQFTKEGFIYKNTIASYVHLHFASNPKFAEGFVRLCEKKSS